MEGRFTFELPRATSRLWGCVECFRVGLKGARCAMVIAFGLCMASFSWIWPFESCSRWSVKTENRVLVPSASCKMRVRVCVSRTYVRGYVLLSYCTSSHSGLQCPYRIDCRPPSIRLPIIYQMFPRWVTTQTWFRSHMNGLGHIGCFTVILVSSKWR